MTDSRRSEAEQRLGLQPGQFPFKSRFLDCNGARIHYVDEGAGPTLLMLHGNPTWSAVFRPLIEHLGGGFRCIALDLPGFGLSDPPPDYGFRPDEHAVIVSRFLELLDIRDATLIAHDWGGPIGIDATLRTGRIGGLCLGNTFAWPVNGELHFVWFSKLLGGPIGRFATNRFAFLINGFMPMAMRRHKLTQADMAVYRAPFANGRSRTPMHIFPAQITGARDWLQSIESRLAAFAGPVHFLWPEDDFAFRKIELARWLAIWPRASVTPIARCGHYLWLDAPEECAAAVREWMHRRADTAQDHPADAPRVHAA
jgi:haloalkane dehalogenase